MADTISAILIKYQTQKRAAGYSQDTIDRVVGNVSQYSSQMHVRSLKRFTTDSVLQWGDKKLSAGRSSSTIYAYYNSIRSFAVFAEALGYEINIDKTRIRCRPHYGARSFLRPYQVRKLIQHGDFRTAALIRLMFTSGCRLSEAISLTRDQVTESTDLTIYIMGKGGKTRPIFITKRIKSELIELSDGGEYCFVDETGKRMTRSMAYYWIKKAMVDARMSHASPHSLRRSFVTTMLVRGADVSHVQRMAGHSSIATTQIYAQLMIDDIRRVHKKYLVEV